MRECDRSPPRLTRRQREVVGLLAAGLTCPQVARRLGISVKTVRKHVAAVAEKLPQTPDVPALRRVRRYAAELLEAA